MMKFVELFLITYKVRLMEEQLWQQQAEKIQKEENYTQENHKERMESIFIGIQTHTLVKEHLYMRMIYQN